MNQVFYRLPIRFGNLMAGREMPTCNAGASIGQVLYVLLHTHYGELRSDRSFGCKIWDAQFDHSLTRTHWLDYLCESFETAIGQHERRIKGAHVTAQFQPIDHQNQPQPIPEDYQQRLIVTVTATLVETEEPFRFSTRLHLGQLLAR